MKSEIVLKVHQKRKNECKKERKTQLSTNMCTKHQYSKIKKVKKVIKTQIYLQYSKISKCS